LRYLGKICINAKLNHTREIVVMEIIARTAQKLIKDGLLYLSEDEEASFTMNNIRKCVKHYLNEIFNVYDLINKDQPPSSDPLA